jgi:hypothetical protein
MQVKLPVKLARELRISPGDEFYWRRSDDDPDVLVLLPSEVVERRYSVGERLEAAARTSATELDHPLEPAADPGEPPP